MGDLSDTFVNEGLADAHNYLLDIQSDLLAGNVRGESASWTLGRKRGIGVS